jgi:putative transposase
MVSPTIRRQVVGHVMKAHKLSERRACGALAVSRTSHRYQSKRQEPADLVEKLRTLSAERPRFGYRRLYRLLRRRGHPEVNHKQVYRLYRLQGLHVRTKRRRRFAASPRVELPKATRPNQVWSMDFVSDHLVNGRRFRILTVVDQFSRRCPGALVDTSIPGRRVAWFLDELAASRGGYPETITVDNGPEFISNALDQWATERGVRLQFSRPGKPVDNAFVEAFNGRLRDECLNANWFYSLDDARILVEGWIKDYNEERPHSALGGLTPIEYERDQLRTSDVV